MRTKLLDYCLEIRRCRSLNKAARNLFISQPALSEALSSLEDELGFKLFNRSHKGMETTPEGARVLDDAERILATMNEWKSLAPETGAPPPVHVAACPLPYNALLLPAMNDLHLVGARLTMFPYEVKAPLIPAFMEKRRASIGITFVLSKDKRLLQRQAEKNGWHMETLLHDEFHVFLGASHPLAVKKALTTEDMTTLPLALYPDDDETSFMTLFAPFFNRERSLRLSNFQHIIAAVAGGLAACIFPRRLMPGIPQAASGEIRGIPFARKPDPVEYCLLTLPATQLSQADKRVIRELKSRLPDDEADGCSEREREREKNSFLISHGYESVAEAVITSPASRLLHGHSASRGQSVPARKCMPPRAGQNIMSGLRRQ